MMKEVTEIIKDSKGLCRDHKARSFVEHFRVNEDLCFHCRANHACLRLSKIVNNESFQRHSSYRERRGYDKMDRRNS